jgi:2-polyprenyl-3-methyl-5-hydroxy-6-metoxy-1,4-benzoquinol methylase
MDLCKKLEFEYAEKLRNSDAATRKLLYSEAYDSVGSHRVFRSDRPEDRTAGTSSELVDWMAQFIGPQEDVLEVGCGRGYTCLKLAPRVRSIVGTDVSELALEEARTVLASAGIVNATIENVSGYELLPHFARGQFDSVISIEVVEHLHPDDAEEHLRQVFALLRPGGKYLTITPNRLDGPHDITREEYPHLKRAIGFHLNETTYREMVALMKRIGFRRFRSFEPVSRGAGKRKAIGLPAGVNQLCETLYAAGLRLHVLKRLMEIRLIAYKPGIAS